MFASQAALVIANAPPAPRGAAGQGRPGGPGEHRSRRRAGLRRQDGEPGVGEPGGQEDRQRPVRTGRDGGAAPGGADLPAGRRAGGLPGGVPPGPGADDGGDGAGRGDRPPGPRRAQRDHPGQLHAHLLGGGGGRVGGCHHAGHDAAGGGGAAAGRVPGHGEPRTASPADLHQGLRRHPAGIPELPGPRRDGPVPPHHRVPGKPDAGTDHRPPGRGPHRGGHPVRHPRTRGGGGPG